MEIYGDTQFFFSFPKIISVIKIGLFVDSGTEIYWVIKQLEIWTIIWQRSSMQTSSCVSSLCVSVYLGRVFFCNFLFLHEARVKMEASRRIHNEKPTVDEEKRDKNGKKGISFGTRLFLFISFVCTFWVVVGVSWVKYPESLANYASPGRWRNVETKEEKW